MSPVLDTRMVYGARCGWWGTIQEIGRHSSGLPCCPVCKGVLFELPNMEDWWAGVDKYEAAGHPGYRAFVEWTKGKHYPSFKDAAAAYTVETGKESGL